ncbi:MAG: 3-deoxy-7-phosphoheptulonate synthase [Candidatus Nephthysia bennettiae]|nr:MAG: 3-deoxy-7-phosphoheptulonate synthase [Candidatus Dormibacteraeota bacterium]
MEQETRAVVEVEVESAEPVARRTVRIGKVIVGRGRPVVIAGPCAVEPSYVGQAEELAQTGIDALRACVYKPRTHPDSFQGLGAEAAPLLDEARRRTGLPLVSEVLSAEDAEAIGEHVDAYQVGARNMQNVRLLEALGEIGRPVVLKRGLSATIDEWVAASEYVRRRGNDQVILCERGIRTFETRTRNTLDLSSVIVARELTDLPVIVDPSHAAGNRDWVPALARAALAAGADGLLVEAHPAPARAWSDGNQAIGLEALAGLAGEARLRHERGLEAADATDSHYLLAFVDGELERLLEARRRLSGLMTEATA